MTEKRCRRCGETKPVAAFRPNLRMRDGLGSWCRACAVERTRQWRAEKREEILRRRREHYRQHVEAERARARAAYAGRRQGGWLRT